jgi:hypothetical protein
MNDRRDVSGPAVSLLYFAMVDIGAALGVVEMFDGF